jgi:hypothetical protein
MTRSKQKSNKLSAVLGVRLHVSDTADKSPHDSVNDCHAKSLGFRLYFGHQLQPLVNTFKERLVKN